MQNRFLKTFLLTLLASLGLTPTDILTAQTFKTLHNFAGSSAPSSTNMDGAFPYASLLLSSNILYGTTSAGGTAGQGGIAFKINVDGTGFSNLHSFPNTFSGFPIGGMNSDGSVPRANLIIAGNTLYGTASVGGTVSGRGAVFEVNTDGSAFANLHSFAVSEGGNPVGALVLSGNALYGTDQSFVFSIPATGGLSVTKVHTFSATSGSNSTNSDGTFPQGSLVLANGFLYGTSRQGGTFGQGTIYGVNTNGTIFTNLHNFTALSASAGIGTNSDGALAESGLVLSGSTLYGVASAGGLYARGAVFAVNTNGTGFTNLYNFSSGTGSLPIFTNSDGASPYGVLALSGHTLYGTTFSGGKTSSGTIFAINADGSGFTNLYTFSAAPGNPAINIDGAYPQAGVIVSGYTLYGTTLNGGSAGKGTAFSLSFTPQLSVTTFGTNIILTWPTNVAGFDYTGFALQATTNVVPPLIWTNVSPAPVTVNGMNTVTNPLSGTQMFFRLSQ